ncbi:4Fe-4S ferredoxin, iron-sulfur binding [Desulfosporosinus sp. I2]|nr:4Fe-4S ferredoxin, iron-sulfur binding [Desulfosporosinus sp. I2]
MMVVDKKTAGGNLNILKYIIWVPWILSIILVAIRAGGLHAINFFYQTDGGISVSNTQSYIVYYFFVALIVILSLAAGRRAFCHYLCWMAPFMVIGSKIKTALGLPSLNIHSSKENCNNCKSCERVCPMSLSVSLMVQKGTMSNTECILCGQCIDTCKMEVLRFTFRNRPR